MDWIKRIFKNNSCALYFEISRVSDASCEHFPTRLQRSAIEKKLIRCAGMDQLMLFNQLVRFAWSSRMARHTFSIEVRRIQIEQNENARELNRASWLAYVIRFDSVDIAYNLRSTFRYNGVERSNNFSRGKCDPF